ncbi:MAG: hypothetical protein R3F29_11070 [Planctomycetota bacterium]
MTDHDLEVARQRAQELQMEACLTELGGDRPDLTFVNRIVAACADARASGTAVVTHQPQWLIAAGVLLGLAVVAAVSWLRWDAPQHVAAPPAPLDGTQDPKPAPPPAPKKKAYTLIADYSDNRVVEVDDAGRITLEINDVYGAWDAEVLANGNVLVTEFSLSRVQELTREGKSVWKYENLKNPYDADRLPNGNTLIADTFAGRVIEVNPKGEIVWSYDQEIRPFDVDRLGNGYTLIADVLKDRVLEIDPKGEIVWQVGDMPNCHDADRLPNGNTLITLRNKGEVVEVDKAGKIVWRLKGLSSPSDADRLPNGNTIVAENTRVREFDKDGEVMWKKDMTWAVEVNRYER